MRIKLRRRRVAPAAPVSPVDDSWRPGRTYWHLRVVRRGRDKQWHFVGREPDEVVKKVVRKHPWFLVRPALPLVGACLFLILVVFASVALPAAETLWILLDIVAIVLIIVTAIYFFWKDFITWWFNLTIITNKRVINWRGFLQPSRQETPIEKIQQVAIHQDTPWQTFLNYGDVHVYLTGGEVVLQDVPAPKQVKDIIQGVTETFSASKKPKEKPPVLVDPQMQAVLEELAKPKEIKKLPSPDDKYPPLPANRRIGPRRRFGGPLRIPADVRYSWGEYTVMYIQHSYFVLARRLALPVLALLVALPLAIYLPVRGTVSGSIEPLWGAVMTMVVIGLLLFIGNIYVNFVDDVYILTNRRIIDIERKLVFFYEARIETEYKNIRDIRVKIPNVLARALDIGTVYVETPGSSPDIILKEVAHPLFIQDRIYELKGYKEKADEYKKENDQKEQLHLWFGKVFQEWEREQAQAPQLKGAPDLENLELLDAMQRANEAGFQVVVWDEAPHDGFPPGIVVHQNPPPGTVISRGGQIQIVLSS